MIATPPAEPTTSLGSHRGTRLGLLSAGCVIAASTAGRLISKAPVAGWYTTLVKPSFNPPNWAFPVAWTLLFALMGVAFWRILRTPVGTPWRPAAVALFVTQLVLNVAWSVAFFGAHSPLFGMCVIVPFWLTILATALVFHRLDRPAAWLLAPYLAWVAFATLLNAAIWRMN
jgi:tryptophan-rich sensory protein